jgi:hypothetical protein
MGDLSQEMAKRYFDAATVIVDQQDRQLTQCVSDLNHTILRCIALQTVVMHERENSGQSQDNEDTGYLTSMSSTGLVDSDRDSGSSGEEDLDSEDE